MGKHKEKKHKREKKRKEKKHKKRKSTSSSEYSSDEWVEKCKSSDEEIPTKNISDNLDCFKSEKPQTSMSSNRDEWMSLPTLYSSVSNLEKRRSREENRRLEKEESQYDPRKCSRELNPYWKDGGDGLPKFKKPSSDDEKDFSYKKSKHQSHHRLSNWRKRDSPKSDSYKKHDKEKIDTVTNTSDQTVLSDKELNVLASKLVKAEIMGNTQLISELKEKLEIARKLRKNASSTNESEEVLLTHTDYKGQSRPLKEPSYSGATKKQKVDTHKDGQRVKYFADDDKYSLREMFENEKFNTVENRNMEFIKMSGKVSKNDDLDDVFSDNIRKLDSDSKVEARNKDRAINEHQRVAKSLDNCNKCIQSESMLKNLMITMGETMYLTLPHHEPLTEGHCLIVPIRHVSCSTQLDENEWSEVMDFRKSLTKMFISKNEDVIYFETAINLHRYPHMKIECIPLPKEEGDLAPIYFKKAIDESEIEWTQNKKLVSMKGKDVRKVIPKGLSYFFVSFGMEEGFAHVIEDEKIFPSNFAQEIIGGMLDLHHSKWRKPKRQSFDEQSKRVLEFSKEWKSFECKSNSL